MDTHARDSQFGGKHRTRLAFADAAQQQHGAARIQIASGKDGSGIEVINALALLTTPINEAARARATLPRVPSRGSALWALSAAWVKMFFDPSGALFFA